MPQEEIKHLATCTPSSASRTWSSVPHPSLPLLATACADKTVRIYSLTSFTLLSTITGGHRRSVRSCAWRPAVKSNEVVLATGSFDATAAIWIGQNKQSRIEDLDDPENDDTEDYRFAVVLEGHDSEIKSIDWSANGRFLATCSRDKSVWIWESLDDAGRGEYGGMIGGRDEEDEDNYETVAVLQEHDGDVKCVKWHPTDEGCLASGSYDDQLRVWREDVDGEWSCVGLCEGHKGTVWSVVWEPVPEEDGRSSADNEAQAESGPRIASCSDDLTIRLWRRKPKVKPKWSTGPRIPSIIRNSGDDEEWTEEAQLPMAHDRAIYSLSWSPRSNRIVSTGSDGKIVVYEEQQDSQTGTDIVMQETSHVADGTELGNNKPTGKWTVIAQVSGSHGVYEVNNVSWAPRYDKGKQSAKDEVIITTGDDGEVKIWTLE